MNIEEIKLRLKERRITRAELGEKLGVSKASVDNWLCGSRPIPHAKLRLIELLLEPAAPAAPPAGVPDLEAVKVLVIRMTAEQRALCVEAARKARMDFEDWARAAIMSVAEADLKKAERAASLPRGRTD